VSRPSTAFSLPQTIKAARAYVAARKSRWEAKFTCWEAQFALGDALNVECPVGPNGVNNDATDLLKNVEQVLLDNGIKIGFRRLEMFRSVAHAWSEPRRRHRGVSLDAHLAAGNPDRLDAIVREAKPDQPITSRYVREKVKQKDAKKRRTHGSAGGSAKQHPPLPPTTRTVPQSKRAAKPGISIRRSGNTLRS
jgi:hypothetical protein